MRARCTALALALAVGVAGARARAQSTASDAAGEGPQVEAARGQYRDGVAAFRARRFGDAVVAFERSLRAVPHPATQYNLAESRLRAGDTEGALSDLRTLLAMTNPAPDAATIERARALAREAHEDNLQPAPSRAAQTPLACPPCTVANCPPVTPQVVSAPGPGPLPWVFLGTGTVALTAGAFVYAWALADSVAYNRGDAPEAFRREIRDEGETFRVAGLVTGIAGLALDVTGVVLFALPRGGGERRAQAGSRVTARVGLGPGAVSVAGTF